MFQHKNNILHDNKKIILPNSKIVSLGNHNSNQLNLFFKKLQNDLGCTYVFYIFENILHNNKIIYTSDQKWQNLLVGEKIINDCPVFKAAIEGLTNKKQSILLPWNYIPCKTSREKDITLLRSEFNIANGIGISHINGCFREGIGFGADVKDINFYQRLINNNLIYILMRKISYLAMRNIKLQTEPQRIIH